MMPDILNKLIPNPMTVLVQLAATFIIYLIYKKFLHQPVVDYLDARAKEMKEAEGYADKVEQDAKKRQEQLKAEHKKALENVERLRAQTIKDIDSEREKLLNNAHAESDRILQRASEQIDASREAMIKEVEDHALDLAISITKRTLQDVDVNEEETFKSLEAEMDRVLDESR